MIGYKVVIVGNTQVGKTCIVDSLLTGCFNDSANPTIGATFTNVIIKRSPTESVKLNIWDTAGQEKYHSITSTYYRNASVAVVVFDVTDLGSYNDTSRWISDLRSKGSPGIKIVLVGNKTDLAADRVILRETAESLVQAQRLEFYHEVSALKGDGIQELFRKVAALDMSVDSLESTKIQINESTDSSCC